MSSPELSPPMNQVFLDFENVHHIDLSIIGSRSVSFTLLLGANQSKLDAAVVEKLMERAASVQLVRLTTSGRNALDFALAYYVGRAAIADPTAHFHIISKDKGFDSLVAHLNSRHIKANRHDDYSSLTFSTSARLPAAQTQPPAPPAKPEKAPPKASLDHTLEYLRKKKTNRPKRKKTLISDLLAHLGKGTTEAHVGSLIKKLEKEGHISLTDKDAVDYHLDA